MGNAPNSHPVESAGIWIQALTEDLGNMKTNNADLSPLQRDALLGALKGRFEGNMARHRGLVWAKAQARLEARPDKLWSLAEMERTGGEPDVVGHDKKSGEYVFMDCAPESPAGRRSVSYDLQNLDVVNQTQSSLFGWRSQFTPEFVTRDLCEAASRIFSAQSL